MMTAKEAATVASNKNYGHIDEDKQFHEIMNDIEKAATLGKNQITWYFVTRNNKTRFSAMGYTVSSNIIPDDGIHSTTFQWWLK